MNIVIDALAAVILLFFFLSGWHRGFLLSLLGIVRVVLAYGAAYYAGRYLGDWLGEVTHRARILSIPIVASIAFLGVTFLFQLLAESIGMRHREAEEEEEHRIGLGSFSGGALNLLGGVLTLVLLFWLADLFAVGVTGNSIPGADTSRFGRFARRSVYEASRLVLPVREHNPLQATSLARMISRPAEAMQIAERLAATDSIRQLAANEQLAADLLSGDANRIQQNTAIQQLLNDRRTLEDLRDLGILSGSETRSGLCSKLAAFGQNDTIRTSLESLRDREMLKPEKIPQLIRDPDFDAVVGELLR